MDEHINGEWRCSRCASAEHLYACAGATVSGLLLPDGSVEESDSTQHTLFEDSIECEVHLSQEPLERWFDGHWTRWVPCSWTEVDNRYRFPLVERCENGSRMRGGTYSGACPDCGGAGGRWTPVEESVTAPIAPRQPAVPDTRKEPS